MPKLHNYTLKEALALARSRCAVPLTLGEKPLIVVDFDDTIWNKNGTSNSLVVEWIKWAIDQHGGDAQCVAIVTARNGISKESIEAVSRCLKHLSLPEIQVVFRPRNISNTLASIAVWKAQVRMSYRSSGYHILASIGDNWGDCIDPEIWEDSSLPDLPFIGRGVVVFKDASADGYMGVVVGTQTS